MDGNASGAGQHAPQGQCNAQTEHRDADRMPVRHRAAAQHGKEIFQWDWRSWRLLCRVVAVHQVRKRQAQCVGQRFQRIDVRQTDAAFPAADGLVGHMQLFGQLGLGQALRPAHLGKKGTEHFCVHTDHILFHRIADLCGKRNRRNVYPRF